MHSLAFLALASVGPAFLTPTAFAANKDVAPLPLGSKFDGLSSAMNAFQGQALKNVFTSCMMPQAELALNAITGKNKGLYSIQSPCPNVTLRGGDQRISCEALFPNGNFNEALFTSLKQRNETMSEALACRKGKIAAIRGEVECLSKAADTLAQQTSSIQQAYQQNISRMTQDVAQLDAAVEDRQAQYARVGEILFGSKDTGMAGIQQLRDQTAKMLQNMATQVPQLKEQKLQLDQQRQAFQYQKEMRTMALASGCFKERKDPAFRCVPNGPPVTAYEYVLCRYEQQQIAKTGRPGQINQNKALQNAAASSRAGLQQLLDQIFGEAPAFEMQAAPQGQPAGAAPQPGFAPRVGIRNVADAKKQYGDRLTSYNGKGLDIRGFIFKELGQCETRAKTQVQRELEMPSTVSAARQALQGQERGLTASYNQAIDDYANAYTEALRSLTGMNLPVNTVGCRNGSPDIQATCVDKLHNNLRGIMNGSTPESSMKIQVDGVNAQNAITFECQGLDGCATKLNNLATNLKREVSRVETYKRQYVQQANQNIENFTNQIAQQLSPQSQALRNRLKELNMAMSSLGLRGGIQIDDLEKESLQPGEGKPPTLYRLPENALKLIGGRMNPPMLDVSRSNFSDAGESLADGEERITEQESILEAAKRDLATAPQECQSQVDKEGQDAIDEMFAALSDRQCDQEVHRCGQSDAVSRLVADLNRIARAPGGGEGFSTRGFSGEIAGAFATGIESACPDQGSVMGSSGTNPASARAAPQAKLGDSIVSKEEEYLNSKCRPKALSKMKVADAGRDFASKGQVEKKLEALQIEKTKEVDPMKLQLLVHEIEKYEKLIAVYDTAIEECRETINSRMVSCRGIYKQLEGKITRIKGRTRYNGASEAESAKGDEEDE